MNRKELIRYVAQNVRQICMSFTGMSVNESLPAMKGKIIAFLNQTDRQYHLYPFCTGVTAKMLRRSNNMPIGWDDVDDDWVLWVRGYNVETTTRNMATVLFSLIPIGPYFRSPFPDEDDTNLLDEMQR